MGLFSFIKEAGEKLFGGKPAQAATAGAPSAQAFECPSGASHYHLHPSSKPGPGKTCRSRLMAARGKVTVRGVAPPKRPKKKVTLCCGNVASVQSVDNEMTVTQPEPEAQYHDVVRGDTLSAIAKKFDGDANKYPVIFEANKPMLTHPAEDLPGSKTAHSRAVIAPCPPSQPDRLAFLWPGRRRGWEAGLGERLLQRPRCQMAHIAPNPPGSGPGVSRASG